MGLRTIFVCDACGCEDPGAECKRRMSVRDVSQLDNELEQPGAVEVCAACALEVGAVLVREAVSRAENERPGYVTSWVVRVDRIPLSLPKRSGVVRPPAALPALPPMPGQPSPELASAALVGGSATAIPLDVDDALEDEPGAPT